MQDVPGEGCGETTISWDFSCGEKTLFPAIQPATWLPAAFQLKEYPLLAAIPAPAEIPDQVRCASGINDPI
jgi:hypothetical protein